VTTDSLDQHFRTFQRSRDPAALAAVFDAAAPRLLLVAMHLVRDAATAEDLVQTVFLQVLRDAAGFDARRPVLPWLLGLLEHRASDARRRAHVQRERGPEALPLAASAVPSPERTAADAEARQRVAEALAGMPHDYRHVLTLRLVHGLAAVDIAHSLGVPPATVRTRLKRGLELLRGALPRGLATPVLLAWLGGEALRASDGLQAVRAKVLAAAGGGALSLVAAWSLAAVAALLLALAAARAWPTSPSPSAPAASDAPALVAGAGAGFADGTNTEGSQAERTRVPMPNDGAADLRRTRVHGRVIAADARTPLAGVAVSMRSWPEGTSAVPDGWRDPEPLVTDRSGAFEFWFVPSSSLTHELQFALPGRVLDWLSFGPLREGVQFDVGDVALSAGTPVRLRLLFAEEPLVGVDLMAALSTDGERPRSMRSYGLSDADGCIDLGTCLPGTWHYEVASNLGDNTGVFVVPLQGGVHEVAIRLAELARADSITGVLLDAAGAPMAGVELGIAAKRGGYYPSRTDGRGRFVFRRVPLQPSTVRIELFQRPREMVWLDDGGDIAWGAHDLRLVVRRRATATLRLEVVDAATGQPIERFGATCWPDGWTAREPSYVDMKRREPTPHPGGVALLQGLLPGPSFVSVFPEAPYAECAEQPIVLGEGDVMTKRIELRTPASCNVRVVDADRGDPVRGVDVVLAKVVPEAHLADVDLDTWRVDLARARAGLGYSSATNVVALARGSSDAEGGVILQVPPDLRALVLYAEGPLCHRMLQKGIQVPPDGASVTIVVTRAAQVRGTLGPLEFVSRFGPMPSALERARQRARTQIVDANEFDSDYPAVELRPVGGAGARLRTHVRSDGAFELGGVAGGRYECWVFVFARTADGGGYEQELGPLAAIDVAPGAMGEPVRLDASQFVPGRAAVTFYLDGQPFHGEVALRSDRVHLRQRTDASGRIDSPWLLPGTYHATAEFESHGPSHATFDPQPLRIAPGQRVAAVANLQRRAITVELVDAQGAPLPDRWLRLRVLDHALLAADFPFARTDAAGQARFQAAPPGRLQLLLLTPEQIAEQTQDAGVPLQELAAGETRVRCVLPR
jgi:RNA polymerase sigma-70 factor (ECF subfamily)